MGDGIAAEPMIVDVSVPPNTRKRLPVDAYSNAFAYVFAGSADFNDASRPHGVRVEKEFQGEELNIRDMSGNRTLVRFVLVSGRPLQEPVAWHGPIVMNTQEELRQAI